MKTKKLIIAAAVTVSVLSIAAVLMYLTVSFLNPHIYTEKCFYSNREKLEQLPEYFRELQADGIEKVSTDWDMPWDEPESTTYNEVKSILAGLQEQYQKDSDYPVFAAVCADYDENGNIQLYLQTRKKKLRNGNGMDSPDIRCYYLVYIDENYSGSSKLQIDKNYYEPFCGNWYTWSTDTFLG